MCDRFKKLPDEVMAHSSELFRMIELERMVTGDG
jgi:hypothetical protein